MADVPTQGDEVQRAPQPVAEMPPSAAAFAGKAKDLGALRDAVVDAANVGAGLWFSYLFVLLYLTVAVGGVTHRNLLFESPVKLPFLGVDLPLVGFFVLGPALFLIVHAYVLLHFAMLADKVGVFHAELQAQIADDTVRARLRRQLPSNIFVQFLAGPLEVRSGLMGTMLRLIAQISLVVGPLALLVFFQLQFLPYHDEAVSWWQRIAVLADLILLWALWPSVARGETSSIAWRDLRRPRVVAAALASLLPILLVFTIATFPGEWLNRNLIALPIIPRFESGSIRWIAPHEFLVAGDVDLVAAKPASIWFNRLVLPGIELKTGDSVTLRGRNLEGAILLNANLQKMDFTATRLRGAVLNGADLREAKFLCTDTRLKNADENPGTADEQCAQLQSAFLVDARLGGADLSGAHMRGVKLDKADLRGATLDDAHLEGASLDNARLHGASLFGTRLLGASLQSAMLHGAVLDYAQLQGAYLDDARMQGASLRFTHFEGASLRGAALEGARFGQARLLGAVLDAAYLRGASFDRVLAWRSRAQTDRGPPLVVAPDMAPVRQEESVGRRLPANCVGANPCDWTAERFAELTKRVLDRLSDGPRRDRVLAQISALDPATPLAGEERWAEMWANWARSPPSADERNKSLVDALKKAGCAAEGAPHVIHRWLAAFDERLLADDPPALALTTAFLDEAQCPAARVLSSEDKGTLLGLRIRASH